jgi:hypothetical protein
MRRTNSRTIKMFRRCPRLERHHGPPQPAAQGRPPHRWRPVKRCSKPSGFGHISGSSFGGAGFGHISGSSSGGAGFGQISGSSSRGGTSRTRITDGSLDCSMLVVARAGFCVATTCARARAFSGPNQHRLPCTVRYCQWPARSAAGGKLVWHSAYAGSTDDRTVHERTATNAPRAI